MSDDQFDGARVIVVEPDLQMQQLICVGLRARGLTHVDGTDSLAKLEDYVGEHLVDLIVGDAEFAEEGFGKIAKRIRQGDHGPNPYLVVMAAIADATEENFKRIVSSGTDNVLVKPINVTTLVDRITTVVHKRKPFVVSSEYIGPDRRLRPRQQVCLPLLEVPNTLKARFNGTFDEEQILAEIAAVNEQVNIQRTKQNAVLINEIVRQIVPHFESGDADDGVLLHLNHLRRAANDSAKRAAESGDDNVAELCRTLIPVTQKLLGNHLKPDEKDLRLLQNLSTSIHMAYETGDRVEALSREISTTIKGAKRFADVDPNAAE